MVDLSLRPALESDFPAIKQLINASGINPTGLDWRRFIIAQTPNGQFAGCGQLKPHSDGTIELASIAVLPALRGLGVARLIIQNLMGSAPRPLYLTCRSELGPFYEKFGFHTVSAGQLPKYFRRISRMAGMASALHIIHVKLLVMIIDR